MLAVILIFIVILGVLVFVHELGHFLVARFHGIKAEEFGFGFPPRMIGIFKHSPNGKYRLVLGQKEYPLRGFFSAFFQALPPGFRGSKDEERKNTIYSLNWIPLGGFVRIKGEDGSGKKDPESFAGRSAWTRVQVMAAGVVMNFLLAWLLFSVVFAIGLPQAVEPGKNFSNTKVQVAEVLPNTPAAHMGLEAGDEIVSIGGTPIRNEAEVRELISKNKGKEITLEINRFGKSLSLSGTPRLEYPSNEGALGFAYVETALVKYSWYQALGKGLEATYTVTVAILEAFGKMLAYPFGGEKVPLDISGPVGIVYLTKQMSDLGFVYLLQFAAILSINLGIINILPIPALDGGRILFVLIEKLKGRPVSQNVEGRIHQIGFIVLLLLMFLVTLRDFAHFQIIEKLGRLF